MNGDFPVGKLFQVDVPGSEQRLIAVFQGPVPDRGVYRFKLINLDTDAIEYWDLAQAAPIFRCFRPLDEVPALR